MKGTAHGGDVGPSVRLSKFAKTPEFENETTVAAVTRAFKSEVILNKERTNAMKGPTERS